MVWFAYEENYYSNYISDHNWYNDEKWSAFGSRALNFTSGIENDYFDNLFFQLETFFDNNTQGGDLPQTDLISCVMTNDNPYTIEDEAKHFVFHTFRTGAKEIFEKSIIKGTTPVNYSELLLLQIDESIENFNINDSLSLRPRTLLRPTAFQNYTISGILDNVEPTLEMLGFSSDIITNDFFSVSYFMGYSGSEPFCAHFFTTPDNFIKIINSYSFFYSNFYFIMDCSYNTSLFEYSEFNNNINQYLKYSKTGITISASANITFYVGKDIYLVLNDFNSVWTLETIKVSALLFPLVFLICLLFIEILHFNEKEQSAIFQHLKLIGLDDKNLSKVILLDSLAASVINFTGGTIMGIFFGMLFARVFQFDQGVVHSFTFLRNPLFLLFSIITFGGFFLMNYLFKRNLLKKTTVTTAKIFSKKRKNIIKKIFTKTEATLAIPGLLLISTGLMGMINIDYYHWVTVPNLVIFLYYLFSLFLFVGACLTLIVCFIVCSKGLFKFLIYTNKKIWRRKKNRFTLALKNVVSFSKVYQRLLLGLFLIGISIIPGIILPSLIQKQNEENANLALGSTDLAINSWNENQTLRSAIENINGVRATTSIKQMELYHRDRTNAFGYNHIYIKLLVINASEFVNTIDLERISTNNKYNIEDIKSLEKNLTFFIDSSCARKINLYKENVIEAEDLFLTEENLKLTFVSDFTVFPAMERYMQVNINSLDIRDIKVSLVFDLVTYNTLANSIANSDISSYQQRLLIRLDSTANITKIKEDIQTNLGLKASSLEDAIVDMNDDVSQFSLRLLLIFVALSFVGVICFTILSSNSVYKEQINIVEINYRLGISRREIINSLLLELLLVTTIPLLLTVLSSVPFIPLYALSLDVNQQYQLLDYWIPFWVLCIVFFVAIIIISITWVVSLYMQLRRYKTVKQE